MGLFGGWRKKTPKSEGTDVAVATLPNAQQPSTTTLPSDTSVFEFGSSSSTDDRVTIAGYCPVSNELEPCRWEVLPSGGSEAPLFRIIF